MWSGGHIYLLQLQEVESQHLDGLDHLQGGNEGGTWGSREPRCRGPTPRTGGAGGGTEAGTGGGRSPQAPGLGCWIRGWPRILAQGQGATGQNWGVGGRVAGSAHQIVQLGVGGKQGLLRPHLRGKQSREVGLGGCTPSTGRERTQGPRGDGTGLCLGPEAAWRGCTPRCRSLPCMVRDPPMALYIPRIPLPTPHTPLISPIPPLPFVPPWPCIPQTPHLPGIPPYPISPIPLPSPLYPPTLQTTPAGGS